ncbi:hypothetical protein SK128_025178 [Halocaridina rubra]|uniref:MAM domain-containing protein n=1 Tax=Halocaridina rubra TaxID=373956 RepID=A0AAN8WZ63_HALRR
MDGSDVREFSINLKDQQMDTRIWNRFGFQSSGWTTAFIGVHSSTIFVIEIEGTQGSNPLSNIAVDDIQFDEAICPENTGALGVSTVHCTFEQGQECGLVDTSHDGWVPTKGDLSLYDHTTQTAEGHMMILRGRNKSIQRLLVTPKLNASSDNCLTFRYRSGGEGSATLSVWVRNTDGYPLSEKIVLKKQAVSEWRSVQVTLYKFFGIGFEVVFQGDIGADPTAFIALDDFYLSNTICLYNTANCAFVDDNTCLWTADKTTDLQWYTSDGSGGHILNGPPSETFKYIMFQTGPHHPSNSVARITSPMISRDPFAPYYCFRFSFTSSVEHSGILSVLYKDNTWNATESKLFELLVTSEFATSKWIRATVPVEDIVEENFLLALQANSWDGREGYIAIRDVSLVKEVCHLLPSAAEPKPMTTLSPGTTTIVPPLVNVILACDFENASAPLCDFKQDIGGNDGIWTRYNAATPPTPMHPSSDHTTHSEAGHYISAAYQTLRDGETSARIRTPPLDPSKDYCFSFFYHHIGNNPPLMRSFAEVIDGPEQITLWGKDNPQQDGWLYVQRDVYADTFLQPFIITIDALLASGQDGDATLDDLQLMDVKCPIPNDNYCTFNTGLCGFTQEEMDDDMDWSWHDSNGNDDPFLPMESKAHYFYIFLNTRAQFTYKGVIYTSIYSVEGPQCFQFQAHMHSTGAVQNSLEVYFVGEGGVTDGILMLVIKEDLGPDWVTVQIPIEAHIKPYRLAIQGIIGDNAMSGFSTLAIDDVRLSPGACVSPGACNFDVSMCSWYSNEHLGNVEWQLTEPDELSLISRPFSDSTHKDNTVNTEMALSVLTTH